MAGLTQIATIQLETAPESGGGRWNAGANGYLAGTSDGRLLAIAATDGIYLYTLATQTRTDFLAAPGMTSDCAFSRDGLMLAAGAGDGTVRLWAVPSGEVQATLAAPHTLILAVAFAPDGHYLAAATGDDPYLVTLWDLRTHRLRTSLTGHTDSVWTVAFSPDGELLASGDEYGTIRLWRVAEGQLLHQIGVQFQGVDSLGFSPDGQLLIAASSALRLWQVSDGALIATLAASPPAYPTCVAVAPTGDLFAAGMHNGFIQLWSIADRRCVANVQGHNQAVRSVAFAGAGRLVSSSPDGVVHVWEI